MSRVVKVAMYLACFLVGQLCQAASITGIVVDDVSQLPVPNSTLRISGGPSPSAAFQAREDGTFQTGDLTPGDYFVVAGREEYLYTSIAVHVEDKTGDESSPKFLSIRLVRLGAIAGHIEGLRGRSAKILALAWSGEPTAAGGIWKPVFDSTATCCGGAPLRGVSVDEKGDFRIQKLPPGVYALLVAYANPQLTDNRGDQDQLGTSTTTGLLRYPEGNEGFELGADGSDLFVQIAVPNGVGRTIKGHVDLRDSRSWYWLTLSSPDQPALSVATTTSDENGAFAFRGVVPGYYELLAVPGIGERGKRPGGPTSVYTGFARLAVDVRQQDSMGIEVTPGQQIGGSFALRESKALPKPSTRCFNAGVTLTTLEDWGVNLERKQDLVQLTLQELPPSPQFMLGLAPARYGLSARMLQGCRLRSQSILDLSRDAPANVEAQVMEPGTIRGHAGIPGQSGAWEVLLIPDDFTEGLSFLPANWFSGSPANEFGWGSFWGIDGPGWLPYIRAATVNPDNSFEFAKAPAGHYRIAVRSADPAGPKPKVVGWRDLKRIELSPSGRVEVDLALPDQPMPPSQQ
jgi:hypothetical protein